MGKEKSKKYQQAFRSAWLHEALLKDWILEIPNNPCKARCRYCKCDLGARHSDLVEHASSKRHKTASAHFSSQRQKTLPFGQEPNKMAKVEAVTALFVTSHSATRSCDHLVDLYKEMFKDSTTASNVQMHYTKCTTVKKNVIGPHFEEDLISDIGAQPLSLLLDESNDISCMKLLGIAVLYYSTTHGKIVSTFLRLTPLKECNADAIVSAILETLKRVKLDVSKLKGMGTDNAIVMVGVNNGDNAKLKEIGNMMFVPLSATGDFSRT